SGYAQLGRERNITSSHSGLLAKPTLLAQGLPQLLLAASWPQAAEMSWPRGRRMNAGTPALVRTSWKARITGIGEELYGSSGAGLCGIRFTLALIPERSFTSSRA